MSSSTVKKKFSISLAVTPLGRSLSLKRQAGDAPSIESKIKGYGHTQMYIRRSKPVLLNTANNVVIDNSPSGDAITNSVKQS